MSDLEVNMALILALLGDISRQLQGVNTSPWMTTREAAHFLRCSESHINQLTDRGLLPFKRQDPTAPRSPRLYHKRHLIAFITIGRNPVKHRLSPEEKRLVDELL